MKFEILVGTQEEVAILGGAMLQIAAMRAGQTMIGQAPTVPPAKPCGCKDKKSDVPAVEVAATDPIIDTLPAAPLVVSEADAHGALQAFVAKRGPSAGIVEAQQLLKTFGAKRLSEVPADRLGEFVEALEVLGA